MSKIIDRVLKLKKLSTSPNPHEAEQAAALALKLQREHAITQADLDAATQVLEDPLVARHSYLTGLRCPASTELVLGDYVQRTSPWKRNLFEAIGVYLGLRVSYTPSTPRMTWYGHASDVTAAAKLYEVCARQIDRQALDYIAQARAEDVRIHGAYSDFNSKGEGAAFRESAVAGLAAKFEELSQESAETEEQGHALVLTRKQKVSDWVDANYTFKTGTGVGFGGDKGYNPAGYEAGKKLNLNADAGLDAANYKKLA